MDILERGKQITSSDLLGWQPRKERFLLCNRKLEFYKESLKAYSYGYWLFTMVVDNVLYFNAYNYSPTTTRHQNTIRYMLDELNIPYVSINVPKSLTEDVIKNESLDYFYDLYFDNLIRIKKRIRKNTRDDIKNHNKQLKNKISNLKSLGITYTYKGELRRKKFHFYAEQTYNEYSKLYNTFIKYRRNQINKDKANNIINRHKEKIRTLNKITNRTLTRHEKNTIYYEYREQLNNIKYSAVYKIASRGSKC